MIFGFEARHSWGKSFNLSKPQFVHLKNGSDGGNVVENSNINIFGMYLIESGLLNVVSLATNTTSCTVFKCF